MKTLIKHIDEGDFQTVVKTRSNGNLIIETGGVEAPKELTVEYSGLTDSGIMSAVESHLTALVYSRADENRLTIIKKLDDVLFG
jgi:hypothetical protein